MASLQRKNDSGFTLVELVIAMAMFTMVLGATAQALISYYSALDLQNQRHSAIRNCTTVISQMRELRDTTDDFPGAIVAAWPNGAAVADAGTLRNESVTVEYLDTNANPLEVTVRSQWLDMRGGPATLSVTTVLTSE